MAGIFKQTIEEGKVYDKVLTRLEFDFADENGHELRLQYAYMDEDWGTGYLELWRTDGQIIQAPYRVMSGLLRGDNHDPLGEVVKFGFSNYNRTPNSHRVEVFLEIIETIIGVDRFSGLWRAQDDFKDVDIFNGTFTDCNGRKYKIQTGHVVAFLEGSPQETSRPAFADAETDDIPF